MWHLLSVAAGLCESHTRTVLRPTIFMRTCVEVARPLLLVRLLDVTVAKGLPHAAQAHDRRPCAGHTHIVQCRVEQRSRTADTALSGA